ncbi:semaphorin-7A-like [Cyprinodon tularosa]|uniref:semaphorin-7A-like n=1 Tax=Cyprinodon tularosa TaxID=77115 RepID=UPI0018E25C80|nr:semaphorin-7A-like [Cyprinodon tularosa]
MDLSNNPLTCISDTRINLNGNDLKADEHSAFVETDKGPHLFLTFSGAQDQAGIHKFGSKRVRPTGPDKEQYYVGLVVSRRENETLQNKVYAFYKEKNKDQGLSKDMWLPFVSQVCTADEGGPKNNLQFKWTSLMNARLYCGNPDSKQHFSELVDVAIVDAPRWQDTRVYGLFRNEWGMSAVCIYTIEDINNIFITSPFNGSKEDDAVDKRRKQCVPDSTKISSDVLMRIEKVSEMKDWVQPLNKMGPVLVKHHNYTRIYVDFSLETQQSVMFLSLSKGFIHKVVQKENHSLIIAEYQPSKPPDHIFSFIFSPSSKTLYVKSKNELIQINMANCHMYGKTCQDCGLSSDPYCIWRNEQCSSVTPHHMVIPSHENCPTRQAYQQSGAAGPKVNNVSLITVPFLSRHFLQCPVSSHHANYIWRGPEGSKPCNLNEGLCLYLIYSMTPKQEGNYACESEEKGYSKVLAQYQLRSTAAGQTFGPRVWLWLFLGLVLNIIH